MRQVSWIVERTPAQSGTRLGLDSTRTPPFSTHTNIIVRHNDTCELAEQARKMGGVAAPYRSLALSVCEVSAVLFVYCPLVGAKGLNSNSNASTET